MSLVNELLANINKYKVKGFLADDEAAALFETAKDVSHLGPCLEVGSYCGKSSVFLGAACKENGTTLYALDHHRGSEEHQAGEEYHDVDLFNAEQAHVDTFPYFRNTLLQFGLEQAVVPLVAPSAVVLRDWATPLAMVFIDGGHSHEMSRADSLGWAEHIVDGGIIAIHDIFERPEYGGQGPYLAMQAVLETMPFEFVEKINSLALLRRC